MKINLSDRKTFYDISRLLFISYIIIFIWIVIFKCSLVDDLKITHQTISKLSFYERILNPSEIESLIYRIQIGEYFHRSILEPLLNIVIFVPIGLYITFFQKEKSILNTFLVSLAMSLSIELIQLATMIGGFSFLDLITNVIGGVIGYSAYRIIYREKRIRILNIISIVLLSISAPISIFGIISTIANIDFYIDVVLRRL